MGSTTFSGPIKSGTVRHTTGTTPSNDMKNVGDVVLSQTFGYTFADTGSFATGIVLPANSQIVDIISHVDVVWNSVTSDALEIGLTGNADEYADVADMTAGGRSTIAVALAQSVVWHNIGTSSVELYLTINSVGGSLTTGSARITVLYAQNNNII